MKWIQGSIISYMRGKTALNMLLGRIRKSIASYGVRREEVLAILDVIQNSPVYFPSLSREEKSSKLDPLKAALENM